MLVLRAVGSGIRALVWKIRYGRRLKIGFPQALKRVTLEIDKEAEVILGERLQNRGELYLGCKEQGKLKIGGHCFFNQNASITCVKGITIGEYCKFGNNLVIVDHDHAVKGEKEEFPGKEIVIGDHVWVGADCVILKGVTIGSHAVIGAGTIVRKDVPEGSSCYDKRETVIR